MKRFIVSMALACLCLTTACFAQKEAVTSEPTKAQAPQESPDFQSIIRPDLMQADGEFENIKVQKLYSDSLASTFLIWVKKGVKAHKHVHHTEQVLVLDGCGTMTIGSDTTHIQKGDWIFIPKGVVHSVVEVHGDTPLKAMSIQTPIFSGKDRVFVE